MLHGSQWHMWSSSMMVQKCSPRSAKIDFCNKLEHCNCKKIPENPSVPALVGHLLCWSCYVPHSSDVPVT